ncbi:Tetratricopeptide-like helical domain-containing protein [Strongyloides ratti]|uniref:Tetratricopeptide-like helical domain-containing protein n=1 Tax=Strongyloides ratti TaxID=34506 RepID=A0A090MXH9_STRRB|nr:Tetratricopeptide-like helical domain-containing protein [Strongyloides ratti]CEF65464.1 Tetratricopeptide-like helical domain-containing protein [Strongyloides ratti]
MKKHWHSFGQAVLKDLNVEIGLKIYQHIGEVAYVWALEELIYVEEKILLSASLLQITGDFDKAEELFLQSSNPIKALDMRRDLLHWEKALALASKLSPNDVPVISKEYAQQLEFMGNYKEALKYYEKGLFDENENTTEEEYHHNEICNCGIARTSLKIGDFKKGIALASQIPIRSLKKECALILEQQKQYFDAANLFELGNFYDRAAAVSLKTKNYTKVTELLKNVRSPKIHSQFGKVMENEGKYKSAVEAYINGSDYDNAVRIYLDYLNDPESAVKLVKESRSIEGAKLVSKFFCSINDKKSAIQFLVFSQCFKEAFQLAEEENLMDIYEDILESYGTSVQFLQIAEYYQEKNNWTKCGKYYYLAGNYLQALEYLLRNDNKDDALYIAIDCVAASKNTSLQDILLQHLIDDKNGIPKDPKLIFKFYISTAKYKEAAKVAVIISDNEQFKGNYRVARDLLFQMSQELFKKNIRLPNTIKSSLVLVHSYLLVKPLMASKRPEIASRLLIRIVQNISKFPSHKIQILTSTVVVCAQAMLFETAYNAAVELMKPENRKFIAEKYKKKIEQVARKRENASKGDVVENFTNCPFCNEPVKEFSLTCFSCKMTLPFCIITGKHIVKDDLAICNNCKFPAFASEFKKLSVKICPMCGENVSNYVIIDDLQKLEFYTQNEN